MKSSLCRAYPAKGRLGPLLVTRVSRVCPPCTVDSALRMLRTVMAWWDRMLTTCPPDQDGWALCMGSHPVLTVTPR